MAKLTRLTAKVFGETADGTLADPEIGQFGSAKAGTYNGTGDVATIQSLPAWSNGWIDSVTPSQQFPPLPEMTGVHKVMSYQEAYLLQQGIPEWDSATTYYTNGFCSKGGKIYKSLSDNNLNNDPASDTVNWNEYILNTTQLTDCILEAPNGIATYSGNEITVKAGLKVLMPNGRNADGTLKNIEYTVPSDYTLTLSHNYAGHFYLKLKTDGTIVYHYFGEQIVKNYSDLPTPASDKYYYCYVEETNEWWQSSNGNPYVTNPMCTLGTFSTDTNNNVTSFNLNYSTNILKLSDSRYISAMSMPSPTYEDLTVGASGTTYTAPANGWVTAWATTNSNSNFLQIGSGIWMTNWNVPNGSTSRVYIPIKRNEGFILNYSGVSISRFRFFYAQGEV